MLKPHTQILRDQVEMTASFETTPVLDIPDIERVTSIALMLIKMHDKIPSSVSLKSYEQTSKE